MQDVINIDGVIICSGAMCSFNLRGAGGELIRKNSKFLVSHCARDHPHEIAEGGNTRNTAMYKEMFTDAVLQALTDIIAEDNYCS